MVLWRFELLAGLAVALRFFELSAGARAALGAALGSIIVKSIAHGQELTANAIYIYILKYISDVQKMAYKLKKYVDSSLNRAFGT